MPRMGEYRPSQSEKNWATEHAAAIVSLHPTLFLAMTTENDQHADAIRAAAKPLSFYQGRTDLEHPFLHIDHATGVIGGHEGRQRAAAVEASGGNAYPVAIVLDNLPARMKPRPFERFVDPAYPGASRQYVVSWSDVPKSWRSTIRGDVYDVRALASEDSIFVLEPSPARAFYYSNSRAGMPDVPSERPAWICLACGDPQASIAQHHDDNVLLACGHTFKLWQLRAELRRDEGASPEAGDLGLPPHAFDWT